MEWQSVVMLSEAQLRNFARIAARVAASGATENPGASPQTRQRTFLPWPTGNPTTQEAGPAGPQGSGQTLKGQRSREPCPMMNRTATITS